MARRVSRLLVIGIVAGCRAPQTDAPPVASFATTQRDLGDIPVAPRGRTVEFPVVNRGSSDLHFRKLVRSCTCVDASVRDTALRPGSAGAVVLTIAPRRAEEKSASVAVHTNDPTRPVVTLRVSWRSHSPVEVDPLEIDFGRVRPGESVQRIATVIRHGPSGKDFGIADVTASPTDRVRVVRRGDELAISLTAGMSPGSQHGRISVRPAGQGQDRLNVPLRWHVADVVEVRPRELMAGTGEPGQRVTSRVIVSAEPGTQLDLKNVYWDGAPSEVATGWRKLTADRGVVELAWTLPKAGGFRRGELVIECAKPAPRTFRVPATAYVFADVPSEEGRSRP